MASVRIDVLMSPLDVSSTSNSSSISSAPHISPDLYNPTSASSPDNQIVLNGSVPPVPRAPQLQQFSKEQAMKSLKESIPLAMKLQNLLKSESGFQKEASSHKKAVRRLSKELYMIVGLYTLLQGVVFATVAQTSKFTCEDWWGPVGIAAAVTLGTLCGALDKLGRMGLEMQEVKKAQRRQSAVYDKIGLLYWKGSACDMKDLEPGHSGIFDSAPGLNSIFSIHGLLVLGFLVGFSGLIIISCTCMLCHPCHCSHG